jgi:hybrid cluster-associated redox disulfide protein
MRPELGGLSVDTVMTRWPQTVRVFIDWQLHCIGCPIAGFHRLDDSAYEHGYQSSDLMQAVEAVIDDPGDATRAAPPRRQRRSAAGGAGP